MSIRNTSHHTRKKQGKINQIGSFLTILLVSFTLLGCGTTDADENDNDSPPPNEVWMENQAFYPQNRTIQEGTTLTWVNKSNEMHTVTSGTDSEHDGEFDSGEIQPNEEFSYTFSETGSYSYFCIPHSPHMTGTITVVEESTDSDNDY